MPGLDSAHSYIDAVRLTLDKAAARLTPQREAVLRALLAHPGRHQSAEEVLVSARQFKSEIGPATVYRTLDMFVKLGVVRRLDTHEGQARYEFNTKGEEHYHHHVICLRCGAIAECNDDLLEVLEERVSNTTGYRIADHCLQFYGYCPACQTEEKCT